MVTKCHCVVDPHWHFQSFRPEFPVVVNTIKTSTVMSVKHVAVDNLKPSACIIQPVINPPPTEAEHGFYLAAKMRMKL